MSIRGKNFRHVQLRSSPIENFDTRTVEFIRPTMVEMLVAISGMPVVADISDWLYMRNGKNGGQRDAPAAAQNDARQRGCQTQEHFGGTITVWSNLARLVGDRL